jgi:hypothetical protein
MFSNLEARRITVARHFAAASLTYNWMDCAGTLERDERKNRDVLIVRRCLLGASLALLMEDF